MSHFERKIKHCTEKNNRTNNTSSNLKVKLLIEKFYYHEAKPPNFRLGQARSKVDFVMTRGYYSIPLVLQGYDDATG
jgi:hypothetical protein